MNEKAGGALSPRFFQTIDSLCVISVYPRWCAVLSEKLLCPEVMYYE